MFLIIKIMHAAWDKQALFHDQNIWFILDNMLSFILSQVFFYRLNDGMLSKVIDIMF